MNRSLVAAALTVAALMPAPAYAWFGWLDKYSGPGPWHGIRLEWRLTCFNDNDVWLDAAAATQSAIAATLSAATGASVQTQARITTALGGSLPNVTGMISPGAAQTRSGIPRATGFVRKASDAREFSASLTAVSQALAQIVVTRKVDPRSEGGGQKPAGEEIVEFDGRVLAAVWKRASDAWLAAADDPSARSFPGLEAIKGISINTTCSDRRDKAFRAEYGTNRRSHANLDVTYQRLWAKAEENFANNEGIVLQLFQPRISWRLVPPPYDVVDVGFSVGAYRFSSEGLDPAWGLLIEPVRFDLHLPARWVDAEKSEKGWLLKRILAPIHGSAGFVIVPGGFRAEDVGATGPRFALGESTFAYGVTYDALALLRAALDLR